MPLSDSACRNAKPKDGDDYKLTDERGLYLLITSSGTKSWRWNYRFGGKQKTMVYGTYPDVSLAVARKRHASARELRAAGTDPNAAKQAIKAEASGRSANSFQVVAERWIKLRRATWVKSHGDRIEARLKADVFPYIGTRPIGEITAPELLKVLRRIEERGASETAHRARSECGQVFRFAIAEGVADRDPSADLRGALRPVKATNFAAITEAAPLADLLRVMHGYSGDPVTRAALKLAPLLFVRPGELRHAKWADINLNGDTPEWRYFVTKTKSQHVVPLARQAVAVLKDLEPLTGAGQYVFPGARSSSRPMSENTVNGALRRMGYPVGTVTGHGFRATARSMLAELGWKIDAIERQLAHKASGPLGTAYDRALYLAERRQMMQSWADYLDHLREGGKVIASSSG